MITSTDLTLVMTSSFAELLTTKMTTYYQKMNHRRL